MKLVERPPREACQPDWAALTTIVRCLDEPKIFGHDKTAYRNRLLQLRVVCWELGHFLEGKESVGTMSLIITFHGAASEVIGSSWGGDGQGPA